MVRIVTRMAMIVRIVTKMVPRVVCIFSWRVSIVKDGQDSPLDG